MNERLKKDVERILAFHVKNAPGVIIGVYMVDYALELLDGVYPDRDSYTMNAICETRECLPDPIQVMTGCTLGNKYLRLHAVENGRYALVLYNRDTSTGFRVYIDVTKIKREKYPQLFAFFNKCRDYKAVTRKELSRLTIEEFYSAGREIFSYQKVKVNIPAKDEQLPAKICSSCGESFLVSGPFNGDLCDYCDDLKNGQSVPFEII